MRSITLLLSAFLFTFLYSGCCNKHDKTIDIAYQLVDENPDSALTLLNGINHDDLGYDMPRYALTYTIAQDKKGLNVDDDSLLRHAFMYYKDKPKDSLYAKCQYYMGKYYMLNDSSEQAVTCFKKSIKAAKATKDKATLCLALNKLAYTTINFNPAQAVAYARRADNIYQTIPDATNSNKAYYKINLSLTLTCADSAKVAVKECGKAIKYAILSGDSITLSDAYQEMSTVLREAGEKKAPLKYAKLTCKLSPTSDMYKNINLAWSYIDADSVKAGKRIIDKLHLIKPIDLYTAYHMRHIAAIKENKYDSARVYSDSAYSYIEKMYSNELNGKINYYTSLIKAQYDKGIIEGRSHIVTVLLITAVFLSLIMIALIVYSYKQYRDKARIKIKAQEKENRLERQIHDEEIKHKEIQLNTMRAYICEKIEIAEKIERIRNNKNKNIALTESDWKEIKTFIENTDSGFLNRLKLKFPNLTDEDMKFMILIRLRLSSKAMAMIYNISEKSIRQKLFVYKTKVGIENDRGLSLRSFIEHF